MSVLGEKVPAPALVQGLPAILVATNTWVFPWISLSKVLASLSLTAIALLRRWKQL